MNEEIWDFGNSIFTDGLLSFLIKSFFSLLAAYIINRLLEHAINRTINRGHIDRMPLKYLGRILKVIIYALAVFSILGSIRPFQGIGTAALGATSIVSVIMGLAAQETFGNFIAGFFLAMEQPFHVGDWIKLSEKNISGRVQTMNFRHTVLKTAENTEIIVPNSVLNSAIVENIAAGESYYTKYISFDIGYDSDLQTARKLIYKAVLSTEEYLDNRSTSEKEEGRDPFVIRIDEFDASGIRITFPIKTADYSSSFVCASKIREKLLASFKENHIEIPYDKIEVLSNN